MTISLGQMRALVATLNDGTRRGISETSRIISEAGVVDTWLYAALMYEHPDVAWIAWETECNPGMTQDEAIRSLRRQGIFPEV